MFENLLLVVDQVILGENSTSHDHGFLDLWVLLSFWPGGLLGTFFSDCLHLNCLVQMYTHKAQLTR